MPRARKVKPGEGPPLIEGETLVEPPSVPCVFNRNHELQSLAIHLGLKTKSGAFRAALFEIRAVVADHFWLKTKYENESTEKSRLASLRPTLHALNKAIDGFAGLDYWTMESLSERGGLPYFDYSAIQLVRDAVEREIEHYDANQKAHRRPDWLLRRTMLCIAGEFRRSCEKKHGSWREFIHEVLTEAGISHPDPDENRSRFDALLPLWARRDLSDTNLASSISERSVKKLAR